MLDARHTGHPSDGHPYFQDHTCLMKAKMPFGSLAKLPKT